MHKLDCASKGRNIKKEKELSYMLGLKLHAYTHTYLFLLHEYKSAQTPNSLYQRREQCDTGERICMRGDQKAEPVSTLWALFENE